MSLLARVCRESGRKRRPGIPDIAAVRLGGEAWCDGAGQNEKIGWRSGLELFKLSLYRAQDAQKSVHVGAVFEAD